MKQWAPCWWRCVSSTKMARLVNFAGMCVIKQSRCLNKRMSKIPLTLRFSDPTMGTQRDLRVKREGRLPLNCPQVCLPPSWQAYASLYHPGPRAISHPIVRKPTPFGTVGSLQLQSCLSQVLVFSDASPPALGLDPDYSFANWSGATVAPTSFPPIFSLAADGAIRTVCCYS